MTEWQDIATAPKDGTVFLGFYPDRTGFAHRRDVLPTAWSGWGGGVWETICGGKPVPGPSHWMPIPSPPQAQGDA